MNSFDAAVYLGLAIAVVTGFNTGLLRSAISILGYLAALPIAMGLVSQLSSQTGDRLGDRLALPFAQNPVLFFAAFLIIGMVLGRVGRMVLDDTMGSQAGAIDRLGGSILGAVRIGLIAITLVLIFDQLLPANQQPAFMGGSRLRPLLSTAGQMGVRSLPPDLIAAIDRLKKDRHI